MGSAKTEAYERNEGKKKIKPAPNRTSSSYTCYLGRKRTPRRIQWHGKTIFYTTTIIHMHCSKTTEWLMCAVHTSVALCFFVSKDNITPRTKHLLLKTIMKWRIGPYKDALRIFLSRVIKSLHCSKKAKNQKYP